MYIYTYVSSFQVCFESAIVFMFRDIHPFVRRFTDASLPCLEGHLHLCRWHQKAFPSTPVADWVVALMSWSIIIIIISSSSSLSIIVIIENNSCNNRKMNNIDHNNRNIIITVSSSIISIIIIIGKVNTNNNSCNNTNNDENTKKHYPHPPWSYPHFAQAISHCPHGLAKSQAWAQRHSSPRDGKGLTYRNWVFFMIQMI